MNNKPYILGLDIGTNSIGWAVVDCQVSEKDGRLLPTGLRNFNSRIFQEMIEKKTEEPKNKQRREARGRRRGLARHRGARRALHKRLVEEDLLPANIDPEAPEESLNAIDRQFAERKAGKPWSQDWSDEEKHWMSPYAMRAVGLTEPLERHEFGRVLLQMQQKRGYFSNRGAKYVSLMENSRVQALGISEKEVENKEIESGEVKQESDAGNGKNKEDKSEADEARQVLGGIKKLKREMEKMQCKTIGEFIWKKSRTEGRPAKRITNYYVETEIKKGRRQGEVDQDKLYGNRSLYKDEFDLLWEQQKERITGLTEELKKDIYKFIYYQRPLRIQKNLVGKCSFLINKSRAARALLEVQEYRMRTAINHIKVSDYGSFDKRPLSQEKRERLFAALHDPDQLNKQGRLALTQIRKIIGLQAKKKWGSEKLNLEEGEAEGESIDNSFSKGGIMGNLTHRTLQGIIGEQWRTMSEDKKKQLVEDLLTIHDKNALFNRLVNEYKPCWTKEDGSPLFTDQQAYDLTCVELEEGYANHCLQVINKLLPHLREGKNYYEACDAAGYVGAGANKAKDMLAHDGAAANLEDGKEEVKELKKPADIANPVVQKALYEIRRLVNSIIREYGKPREVRVELAREMRASKEQRRKIQKQQQENRKLNEESEKELLSHYRAGNTNIQLEERKNKPPRISRKDREKYKLWMELGQGDAVCPYSGEPIGSFNMLLTETTEVDHIIPLSRSNDNSYPNKILCLRSANQEKGNKTPWEAWGKDKEKYQGIVNRMGKLIKYGDKRFEKVLRSKLRKIQMKEVPEGFTAAQLKATQYIAVATKNYLETLSVSVEPAAGQMTAELRRLWGLDGLLPKPSEDKNTDQSASGTAEDEAVARTADEQEKDAAKSRIDHRHHAIDAFVIALTDRSIHANLNKRYKYLEENGQWPDDELPLPELWEEQNVQVNRKKIKKEIRDRVVSHTVNRKVCGSLHKELPYGTTQYYEELELSVKPGTEDKKIINGNPDSMGDDCYVWDKNIRRVLQEWIKNLPKKATERTLPEYAGKKLEKVVVAHRCYVKRIDVKEALKYVKNQEWRPGKGTWIQNKNIYDILRDWNRSHTEKDLEKSPPLMKNNKNPGKANPIKSVRVARKFSSLSVRGANSDTKFYELGNNHHVVIFQCVKDHIDPITGKKIKEGQKTGKYVTMIEAAERASKLRRKWKQGGQLEQVIQRRPDQHNLDADCWKFVMDLTTNDLVQWDESNVPEEHRELGKHVYRVQKMSGVVNQVTFRHHTVSTTDTDYGRLLKSPSALQCKKISVDMLGSIQSVQG